METITLGTGIFGWHLRQEIVRIFCLHFRWMQRLFVQVFCLHSKQLLTPQPETMYAMRLGSRRFIAASHIAHQAPKMNSMAVLSQRTHVYDKRNYIPEIDDYKVMPTARPWDHWTLRANQNRQRRFGQYFLWICTVYVFYAWFRFVVIRQQKNRVEKWDYQTKYWRFE